MIRYLLDTDICTNLIRRRSQKVLSRLRRRTVAAVGISAITVVELLYYSASKISIPAYNLLRLLNLQPPWRSCHSIIRPHRRTENKIRHELEIAGTSIGPLHMLIAANALSLGVTIVTRNVREFRRVPKLKVENWAEDSAETRRYTK